MRISGIDEYIGGADNVKAFSMIQGEQRKFRGTITDQNGAAIDISTFVLSADVEFFTATGTVTARSAELSSFSPNTQEAAKTLTIGVVPGQQANGIFELTIPADLYSPEIPIDISTGIPVAVVYLQFQDRLAANDATIRKSRLIIILRRSVDV